MCEDMYIKNMILYIYSCQACQKVPNMFHMCILIDNEYCNQA